MDHLAARPIFALVAGIILELVFGHVLWRTTKGWLAFAASAIAFVGTLFMIPLIAKGSAIDVNFFTWDKGIDFAYRIDGLAILFTLMATGIGAAILLYCVRYMEHEAEGTTRFYALMLTFIAGLVNLVCSANLLMAYFSWEVIGWCSYFLVGFWYKEQAAVDGARKVLVITHLAGYGFLIAIMLLFVSSGTFTWSDPALRAAFTSGIALSMLVAAMAKSVMFPLHTWIPEAMNAPTPVSALLHSACYVKAGVYLIARMYSIAPWNVSLGTLMLAMGCVTMLVGALFALVQTDLKRLLAFSTISQLGHIVTALALGTPLGIAAGLFYTFSHGLFKGTLFLCSGAVQHATGTRDLRRLGGLAERMPNTTRIWLIAAASIIGVPLTNGFVAKWLLFTSALDAGQMAVVLVAWIVSIFTAFYMLKATVSVFYGDLPDWLRAKQVHDVAPSMQIGMGALGLCCVLFGIAPQLLMQTIVSPAVRALNFDVLVQLSWLGVLTNSASAQVTVGAAMVLIALIVAGALYRMAQPPRSTRVIVFTGGDPLPADDTVSAIDFADMAEMTFAPIYTATNPDPLYLAFWRGVKNVGARTQAFVTPTLENRALIAAFAFAMVVFAAVWIL